MHAYRADRAFDGEREIPGGALVLVENERIVGVEPARAPAPTGCEITYKANTTLLPGLIDAHVHLCANSGTRALDGIPDLSADELDAVIQNSMQAQLRAGVTAVRDLGDHEWAVVDRRRDRQEGPTIIAAGPPITSVGGHCASMGGEAEGINELRAAVRERAERGADLVKIMASGGVMTIGTDVLACQFADHELRAAVEEAHALGLAVTAHAHGVPAVRQSIEAGVDGIEHCSCLGPGGFDSPPDVVEALVTRNIVVCPTLGADLSRIGGVLPAQVTTMMERTGTTIEMRLAQVAQLVAGGVSIISGSDGGINPGKAHGILPISIAELAHCGLSATTALTSATSAASSAIGLGARTGRLRAGLDADLLIVNGSPIDDLAALRSVQSVISRGRHVTLAA